MTSVPSINRHSGVPLYGQIARDLEAQLAGTYEPGDRLPSVSELAERYEVNRLTVHEALGVLVRRGLVTIVKGKGSFVALPIIRWDLRAGQDASLTQAMGSVATPWRTVCSESSRTTIPSCATSCWPLALSSGSKVSDMSTTSRGR